MSRTPFDRALDPSLPFIQPWELPTGTLFPARGRRGAEFAPEVEKAGRTGPAQYVREVRSELKRVHWPSRRELTQYTIVVLVAVTLLMIYIFGLDQTFGQFVFWIFG